MNFIRVSIIMFKFLLTLTLIFSSSFAFAVDKDEAIKFVTSKIVNDFKKGIEAYNTEKVSQLPMFEYDTGYYTFSIKKNNFRFSIVNFIEEKIYINEQLIPFSKLTKTTAPKASFLDFFMSSAFAGEDLPKLDGESAKILLDALTFFNIKLEKVDWMCISNSCKKGLRDRNLEKIFLELKKQNEFCKKSVEETQESFRRYERVLPAMGQNAHLAYSFLGAPEFEDVKKFMSNINMSSKTSVNIVMRDYLLAENKVHQTCMDLMLSLELEMGNEALAKPDIQKSMATAKNNCMALEELKECAINFQADAKFINDKKREAEGYDKAYFFNVPDVNKTFKRAAESSSKSQ